MVSPTNTVQAKTVSIIVPCRNERDHIDAFLDSVLAQRLPPGLMLEVVLADGTSDDGTRARLEARAAAEPQLRVVDNPERITPTALNHAISQARGEVVVRMDVHTVYAEDYVAASVHALQTTGASCVGGAWRPGPARSKRQAVISRAFESRFGSGGAASRREGWSGPVDTVYLGAWWRDELLRLGGFDPALVRNQDDELNLRIHRSGGTVWQSATIRSWYTPRATFGALARQFYQYGYWKVPVIRKHRLPASPRHLVPFGFVATLLGGGLLAPWWPLAGGLATSLAGLYAALALVAAAAEARPWREPGAWIGIAWAFACMHLSYGWGFGRALLETVLLRRGPAASATRLTR